MKSQMSSQHLGCIHKDSSEEEAMMLQDIRKLQPFKTKPGKYHQHFPDITVSPTSTVNMKNLFE